MEHPGAAAQVQKEALLLLYAFPVEFGAGGADSDATTGRVIVGFVGRGVPTHFPPTINQALNP